MQQNSIDQNLANKVLVTIQPGILATEHTEITKKENIEHRKHHMA
jgi:hypothetical protein